jgi:sigma-B regulation protein RsbU (phosphoserine phosphatase)
MKAIDQEMAAAQNTSLSVLAKIEALSRCTEFVLGHAIDAGFTAARLRDVELLVEEIVVNICRHGYDDPPGQLEVRCRCVEAQLLLLEFIDSGRPFDIHAAPPPDLAADLEQREVGGLGVSLIRALADEINYQRSGNRNILSLKVRAKR